MRVRLHFRPKKHNTKLVGSKGGAPKKLRKKLSKAGITAKGASTEKADAVLKRYQALMGKAKAPGLGEKGIIIVNGKPVDAAAEKGIIIINGRPVDASAKGIIVIENKPGA